MRQGFQFTAAVAKPYIECGTPYIQSVVGSRDQCGSLQFFTILPVVRVVQGDCESV